MEDSHARGDRSWHSGIRVIVMTSLLLSVMLEKDYILNNFNRIQISIPETSSMDPRSKFYTLG